MGVERLALDALLEQARAEPKQTRIRFREQLAAFGTEAVEPMRAWLSDPAYGAFAVRVLEEVARKGDRTEAVRALQAGRAGASPGRPGASPIVTRDIDDALGRLGVQTRTTSTSSPGTPSRSSVPTEIDEDLYAFLVTAARESRIVSYSEAGEVVGLTMRNPHHRRLLGQLLGVISTHESEHGRPMLSSIVVHKDQRSKLGQGFYQLGEELRLMEVGEDPDAFARREIANTLDYWKRAN